MGTYTYNINETCFKVNSLIYKNECISKINQEQKSFQKIKYSNNNIFNKEKKSKRICTVFQWDGEAVLVYLTGSFCNWHQFFQMEKSQKQNNKFFLTLFLPKGIYQYKFKIGDKWEYNSNFPTCSDKNGNINNILDLTKEEKEEYFNNEFSKIILTKEEYINNVIITDINKKYLDESYCEFLPPKRDMKYIPQKSPVLYNILFNYDFFSNQKNFGINLFLQYKEQNILNENYSYKKILPLHQVQIDHFNINKKYLYKIKNKKHQNSILIIASTFRFRYKFVTYIYYNTNKNRN